MKIGGRFHTESVPRKFLRPLRSTRAVPQTFSYI
ncbi:MAG: hypothetical protein QOD28_2236 [Acidobacteriota bacterium]|nr:hypothetical protein [Acidobacteriota bacterium]